MEQREHYRSTPSENDGLEVTLETPDGRMFRGEVADVSRNGAGIVFTRTEGPTVCIGDQVKLVFEAPWLRAPLAVPASVRHRMERCLFRQYGLEFVTEIEADALTGRGREIFNRRRTFRVTPEAGHHVEVRLTNTDGSTTTTTLVDISASGVGVTIPMSQDSCFVDDDHVDVKFSLPGNEVPVELRAWIRNRRARGDAVLYGLEFDRDKCERFANHERAIVTYVMKRQQATLRHTSSRA